MSVGPIKVLLVEDNEHEACRLQQVVARGGARDVHIVHERSLADALRCLSLERFDAVLVDLTLAGGSALDALTRIRETAPDVPTIVLSDADDEQLAMRALKEGAQDSLVKSQLDGNLLVRSIRYAIERNQLRMALQAMSLVDDLTSLYNRRGFLTLARQQLKVADRMKKRVSHIFVDLDGLKQINDTVGHRAGDQALLETADLLREVFRDSDIIARIGGDEFVVLAMETTGATADTFASRVQECVTQRNARGERRFPLSLSMGVAYYDPEVPCPLDDLLARADRLMYEDKRSKRSNAPIEVPAIAAPQIVLPSTAGSGIGDRRFSGPPPRAD
jgi:two-component system cell cycle response regulator